MVKGVSLSLSLSLSQCVGCTQWLVPCINIYVKNFSLTMSLSTKMAGCDYKSWGDLHSPFRDTVTLCHSLSWNDSTLLWEGTEKMRNASKSLGLSYSFFLLLDRRISDDWSPRKLSAHVCNFPLSFLLLQMWNWTVSARFEGSYQNRKIDIISTITRYVWRDFWVQRREH